MVSNTGAHQSMALALWRYGSTFLCLFIVNLYPTRIRISIASKNALIHTKSSHLASENFPEMILKGLNESFRNISQLLLVILNCCTDLDRQFEPAMTKFAKDFLD